MVFNKIKKNKITRKKKLILKKKSKKVISKKHTRRMKGKGPSKRIFGTKKKQYTTLNENKYLCPDCKEQFLDKNNYCRGCLENKTKRIQEKQKEINKILEEEGDGDFFIINPNKKPFERPVAHFFHKDEIAAEELLKDYGIMSRRRTLKDKLYQTQPYFRVQVKKDPEDYMEGVIPRKVNTRNFVDNEGEEHLVIKDLPPLIINRKTNSDSKK